MKNMDDWMEIPNNEQRKQKMVNNEQRKKKIM